MKSIAELLSERKRIKKRKPTFLYQDHHRRKELPKRWRRPRGLHSKLRMRKAGHPGHVEIGYGSPVLVRHLDRHGMKRVIVSTPSDLKKLNSKTDSAVIKHGVGLRKKLELSKVAHELGIGIVNAKKEKLDLKLQKWNDNRSPKKVEAKPEAQAKPKKAKPKKEDQSETTEEIKEEEKKEKDKVLTKREI